MSGIGKQTNESRNVNETGLSPGRLPMILVPSRKVCTRLGRPFNWLGSRRASTTGENIMCSQLPAVCVRFKSQRQLIGSCGGESMPNKNWSVLMFPLFSTKIVGQIRNTSRCLAGSLRATSSNSQGSSAGSMKTIRLWLRAQNIGRAWASVPVQVPGQGAHTCARRS